MVGDNYDDDIKGDGAADDSGEDKSGDYIILMTMVLL